MLHTGIYSLKLDCSEIVREWSESIEATGRRRVVLTAVNLPNTVVIPHGRRRHAGTQAVCITLAEADHSLTIHVAYERVACLTSTTADV